MTDRRRRTALATPTDTASVLLRQRRSSSSGSGEPEENPFAAPPEGRPDQPWRPRRSPGSGPSSSGSPGETPEEGRDGEGNSSPNWGGRWSSRQPRRHDGGFGDGRQERPGGPGGGGPGGLRWDPTDPVQRQARYALFSGLWGSIFALLGVPWVAVPLGALALYWGIGSLRAKPGTDGADGSGSTDGTRPGARPEDVAGTDRSAAPEPTTTPLPSPSQPQPGSPYPAHRHSGRPQLTAAVSGLVMGGVALMVVAAQFSVQIAYSDYFTCVEDALTNASREACERHLPEELRPFFGGDE